MKVLMIGGAGFLGLPLTKNFLKVRTEVTCIDTMNYTHYDLIPDSKYLTFIDDDVLNAEDYIDNWNQYDRIVYLASPRLLELDKKDTITKELNRLKWVLEKCKKDCDPNFKFFFTSSCSVYGRQDKKEKFTEEDSLQVTTRYSELKIKSEELVQEAGDNYKIFRLSTLYGYSNPMRHDVLINNLIHDIKEGRQLEIFDKDAKRPHLHVDNCALILFQMICNGFDGKILNIGFDEFNTSKKEIVDTIEKIIDKKLNPIFVDSKDSRDYAVDFSKMRQYEDMWFHDQRTEFSLGIYNLWVGKTNISVEEHDSIIGYHRPHMCSKTWYLKEEGTISFPKSWGEWNVYNEHTKKLFAKEQFEGMVTPINEERYINILPPDKTKKNKHIYLVSIYDPNFFEKNIKIGYSCVSKRYLKDVRENRAKIVFYLTLEGYSGIEGNRDLEIISQWNDEWNIPESNVYYICGNLRIKEVLYKKGLKFKGIPFSAFDIWLNPLHMPSEITPFHPSKEGMFFLSYNRNMDRAHRIGFCSRLLEKDLLHLGTISVGDFEEKNVDTELYPYSKKLKEMVPIEIDTTLQYNLANDLNHDNFHNTFVSVVTETLAHENTLFISEKTWKPIFMGHPFIILGNPGTLKYLKKLGFKTFDKWWDESYDDIKDVHVRTNKIVMIIESLSEKDHHELAKVREEMVEVLEYNRTMFKKMIRSKYHFIHTEHNPQKPIIKILSEIQNGLI